MRTIALSDMTLKTAGGLALSFKEKIELAKLLDVSTVYISLLTKKLSETGDIAYTINADHIKEFYINDKSESN